MHIYITESNIKVGLSAGKLTIKDLNDGSIKNELSFENVDGISVFGKPQISTQLLRECIEKNISVMFYSDDGHYFGHLSSSTHINPERQKKQIYLTDDNGFCLTWAKSIINAKIHNSIALLKSKPEVYEFSDAELHGLFHSQKSLVYAENVDMVLGFEGNAAKCYFACLSKLLKNEDFAFSGRSTRPPKDPFNSMLSYGYSLFYRNIIGAIEAAGLHPHFAYLHKIKLGHAALASDLIEEWRSWLVDRTVVELVNDGSVVVSDFYCNESGAIYMQKPTMKLLTDHLGDVIVRNEEYFLESGDRKRYGFQVALQKKLLMLIDAIDKRDANVYHPFLWSEVGKADGE